MDSFRMGPTTDTIETSTAETRNDSTDSLEDSADDISVNEEERRFGGEEGGERSSSGGGGVASVVDDYDDDDVVHGCKWNGCDRRFGLLDEMVLHVNDEHVRMEDVDYTCRWEGCTRRGRGFNARYKMLIHMRTHTNERPHQCLTCGKCFSRLENLKIHNRSHTGEKPYICSVEGCNKAYSNSSDRFKHTRTHFVDKPFVCKKDGCGKRYTDPSSLRKHMKTYGHREDVDATFAYASAASLVDCQLATNDRGNKVNILKGSNNTSKANQVSPLDLTVSHEEVELQIKWQLETTE